MTVQPAVELADYTARPGQRDALIDQFCAWVGDRPHVPGAGVRAMFRDIDRPEQLLVIRDFARVADPRGAASGMIGMLGGATGVLGEPAIAEGLPGTSMTAHHLVPLEGYGLPTGQCAGALIILDVVPAVDGVALRTAIGGQPDVIAAFTVDAALENGARQHDDRLAVILHTAPDFGPAQRMRGLPAPLYTRRLQPTAQSPLTQAAPAQTPEDFDFLVGDFVVQNRRLRQRQVGSADWDVFPATNRLWKMLGGIANVDAFDCPAKGFQGMSVRALDQSTGIWAIGWIDSRGGTMLPPVRGGFVGDKGAFVGADMDGPVPVLCRFQWDRHPDTPRWAQAFSYDGGASWETNWTMDFTRVTPVRG